MPATKRPRPAPPPPPPPRSESDVILDVEIEAGTLHFVLASIGRAPVHALRVRLSRRVRDLAGLRVDENPLFTRLEFLGPGRRVRLFIDTLEGYVRRRQPLAFEARLEWLDDAGERHRRSIQHDLAAWTQLRETF